MMKITTKTTKQTTTKSTTTTTTKAAIQTTTKTITYDNERDENDEDNDHKINDDGDDNDDNDNTTDNENNNTLAHPCSCCKLVSGPVRASIHNRQRFHNASLFPLPFVGRCYAKRHLDRPTKGGTTGGGS